MARKEQVQCSWDRDTSSGPRRSAASHSTLAVRIPIEGAGSRRCGARPGSEAQTRVSPESRSRCIREDYAPPSSMHRQSERPWYPSGSRDATAKWPIDAYRATVRRARRCAIQGVVALSRRRLRRSHRAYSLRLRRDLWLALNEWATSRHGEGPFPGRRGVRQGSTDSR